MIEKITNAFHKSHQKSFGQSAILRLIRAAGDDRAHRVRSTVREVYHHLQALRNRAEERRRSDKRARDGSRLDRSKPEPVGARLYHCYFFRIETQLIESKPLCDFSDGAEP